jgi:two-component sensor histidine kinase
MTVRGESQETLDVAYWEAVRAGLVLHLEGAYAFFHDRVQEAAYLLLSAASRKTTHLRIGRLLLSGLPKDPTSEQVFAVLNQLNRAVDLIADARERAALLRLNVVAGKKAKASIAISSARNYLAQAAALLAPDAWLAGYDETFDLHLVFSECEYLVGNFTRADELFDLMLERAQSDFDRVKVYGLRMRLYQVSSKYDEAVSVALEALQLFGVTFPESDDELWAAGEAELREIPVNLGGRRIADLIDAPEATDRAVRAIIELLCEATPAAYIGRPQLFPLMHMKAVNFSLRHGNTDQSSYAYGIHALLRVSTVGDIDTAFQFSEMSLRLNEKVNNARLRGTLLHLHGDHVNLWRRHFTTGMPILEKAFRACLEVGDLVYAGFLAFETVWQTIESGIVLDQVLERSDSNATFARQSHNDAVFETIRLEQQFVASLQGRTNDPLSLEDEVFDEQASLAVVVKAAFGCGIVFYYIMKQILAFLHGRFAQALELAARAHPVLPAAMAMPIEASHHFFHALTLTALYPTASPEEQAEYRRILDEKQAKLVLWARHCPENFANRASLVAAEVARIEGRELEAERLYEEAICSARANAFLQQEAIANELAARFHLSRGFETIAGAYLRNARYAYLRWGAHGKVQQLEQAYPSLQEERTAASAMTTIDTPAGQLDLATVVKVSQAVSVELVLDKLIERLLVIAMEHAGAARGLLIMPDADAHRIEAEATTDHAAVSVQLRRAAPTREELPESILHYVARTQESVILGDATGSKQFSCDVYIREHQARSILCLPLVKQGQLMGVLYLENNLTPYVFTPSRTVLLKLLAAQAAISLENVRLYTGLQRSLDERGILLREIHHRVKNNLQLISSLLNLQANRVPDSAVSDLLVDCRNRVRSMALAHENLYRAGNFSSVPMAAHIRNLCDHLISAYRVPSRGIRLAVRVPELDLDLDRAVSCSLIVNELVSNALKHAFPDGRAGSVSVDLEPRGTNRLALVIGDDGVGLPATCDFRNTESLGLQLVNDLTQQLHGSIDVTRQPGTTFTIVFDVATAMDEARASN